MGPVVVPVVQALLLLPEQLVGLLATGLELQGQPAHLARDALVQLRLDLAGVLVGLPEVVATVAVSERQRETKRECGKVRFPN